MKLSTLAILASLCAAAQVSAADGRQSFYPVTTGQQPVAAGQWQDSALIAPTACDCGEPACGCEQVAAPACGCELGAAGGCDGACGGCATDSCCDLGDPFSLFGEHCGWSAGGWLQLGYHTNDIPLFNRHDGNVNLHQAWLYAEKAIDTRNGFDLGGRVDYVYGVDAQDTQAFGTNPRGWDNDWDHGIYGHALPQAYLEAGYGDLSVKVGHFFSIIGYEGVPAPDNFFYSHTYTMYNSEPFTHTGALATYRLNDDVTVYGGYTLGWDSGFDDNGDSFLGGVSTGLTDNWTLSYTTVGGRFDEARFNANNVSERGSLHSIVSDYAVNNKLRYIIQSDLLDTEDAAGRTVRDTFGIAQYLLYNINDCLALGTRFEWYQQEGVFSPVGQNSDIYATTFGVNYRPHANLVFRPEVRVDHDDSNAINLEHGPTQTTFGVDGILTF